MATTRRSKVEIVREYETNPEEDTSSTISQTRMRPRDKVNNNQISIDNVEEVTVEEVQGPNTQTNHNNNLDTQNMRNSVEVDYPDPDAKALVVSTNAERNTGQRPKAEDMNHVRAEQNPERQLVSRKPIRIKIKRDFDRDPGRGVVAIRGSGYNGVQDHMERELERRKMDWEKEVMKMQREFFKLSPGGVMTMGGGAVSPGTEIMDISKARNLYETKPDGSTVYKLRFNVRGFKPSELTVKLEERTLRVTAQHQEEGDLGEKASKNFDRKMDLPDEVVAEELFSELTSDGMLIVEAPVNLPEPEEEKRALPEPKKGYRHLQMTGLHDPDDRSEVETGSFTIGEPFNAAPLKTQDKILTPRPNYLQHGIHELQSPEEIPHQRNYTATSYTSRSPYYRPPSEYLDMPSLEASRSRGFQVERSHTFTPSVSQNQATTTAVARFRPGTEETEEKATYLSAGGAGFITGPASAFTQVALQPPSATGQGPAQHSNNVLGPGDVFGASGPFKGLPAGFTPLFSQSSVTSKRGASHLERINKDAVKLKLSVDVGNDYLPEDIQVEVDEKYIHVKALHEQVTPTGRTARREYNRTFDAPEDLDLDTLQAVVGTDGKLVVGASLLTNLDKLAALDSIRDDQPADGTHVDVLY